jgi:hypothetical protein
MVSVPTPEFPIVTGVELVQVDGSDGLTSPDATASAKAAGCTPRQLKANQTAIPAKQHGLKKYVFKSMWDNFIMRQPWEKSRPDRLGKNQPINGFNFKTARPCTSKTSPHPKTVTGDQTRIWIASEKISSVILTPPLALRNDFKDYNDYFLGGFPYSHAQKRE